MKTPEPFFCECGALIGYCQTPPPTDWADVLCWQCVVQRVEMYRLLTQDVKPLSEAWQMQHKDVNYSDCCQSKEREITQHLNKAWQRFRELNNL